MHKIAVYCGAATGKDPVYEQAATELGHYLATHQLDLVYGGGSFGLMGILARQVLKDGGHVYGVMPRELVDRGAAFNALTDLQIVPDMATRKQTMLTLADGCLALPGGPGTLEEIVEAFSWARLGDNTNPCAFYNVNHYYDPLQRFFDDMVTNGFLTPTDRQKLCFADSLDTILTFMTDYQPPQIRTY